MANETPSNIVYALKIQPKGHEGNLAEKRYILGFRHPNRKTNELTLRYLIPSETIEEFVRRLYGDYFNLYIPSDNPGEFGVLELKIPKYNRRLILKLESGFESKNQDEILKTARFAEDSKMPEPYKGNSVYLRDISLNEKEEFIKNFKLIDKEARKERKDNSG